MIIIPFSAFHFKINQQLSTELDKYKNAFQQIQTEFKSIRGNLTLEKEEKDGQRPAWRKGLTFDASAFGQ